MSIAIADKKLKPLTMLLIAIGFAVFGVFLSKNIASLVFLSLLTQALIYAIFALGPGFLLKQNGMISFGHALFFGISGYLVGMLMVLTDWAPDLIIIFVIVLIGIASFVPALVIVRVSGIAFAMLTLAVGQGFYVMVSRSRGITGGADGMNINFPSHIFGMEINLFQNPTSMFLICWFVLIAVLFVLTLLLRTKFGPLTEAIRENEERTRFIGYRTLIPRAVVYAISAMLSAVAGVLSILYAGFVSPESMHWSVSGMVLIMVILGGGKTLWGPALGAVVYYVFRDYLGEHTTHWMGVLGIALITVIVLWPEGLAGGLKHMYQNLLLSFSKKRSV